MSFGEYYSKKYNCLVCILNGPDAVNHKAVWLEMAWKTSKSKKAISKNCYTMIPFSSPSKIKNTVGKVLCEQNIQQQGKNQGKKKSSQENILCFLFLEIHIKKIHVWKHTNAKCMLIMRFTSSSNPNTVYYDSHNSNYNKRYKWIAKKELNNHIILDPKAGSLELYSNDIKFGYLVTL